MEDRSTDDLRFLPEESAPGVDGGFHSIPTETIFREMILGELRDGRLSPWRRRRIVRYAAAMGLSATEAGRLLDSCRAVFERERTARRRALQADQDVETPPPGEDNRRTSFIAWACIVAGSTLIACGWGLAWWAAS